jgi:hypothetical protein
MSVIIILSVPFGPFEVILTRMVSTKSHQNMDKTSTSKTIRKILRNYQKCRYQSSQLYDNWLFQKIMKRIIKNRN